jgi:hypothetical protein
MGIVHLFSYLILATVFFGIGLLESQSAGTNGQMT